MNVSSLRIAPGWLGLALAVCALPGCTGEVEGANGGTASGSSSGQMPGGGGSGVGTGGGSGGAGVAPAFQPAPGMLRRLTRAQFVNAVRDLLGQEVDASALDADSFDGNFAVVGASTVVTSPTGVEQYGAAIEAAVAKVFANDTARADLLGCTPSGSADDACARGFLSSLGQRAWRRPLETSELERYTSLAASAGTQLGSPVEGLRWATVGLLTAPSFIYRAELGAASADGVMRFTGHEMAARLAFLVWNSVPDNALLADAQAGKLTTKDGTRVAVERLLDAPAGRQAVGQFAEEFLRLDRLLTQAKDSTLFPEYAPALQQAMLRDMRGTWETVVLDDKVSTLQLFSTTKAVVNADLAKLYGVDATGLDASTFRTVSLPADGPRAGILSKAGFLSQFANQKEGSPTLRGKFMREALLCLSVPPPPPNVSTVLEDSSDDQPKTHRDRLEAHRENPTCAGCHALMDPLGLPLEAFDAIGKFRTTEHGLPLDTSGEFNGKPVADARSLGNVMAQDEALMACLTHKYYSYAVGHAERAVDQSVVEALTASFKASGYQLRDLIVQTATSDAFSAVAPQL